VPTPGRIEEESVAFIGLSDAELREKAYEVLQALGGKANIRAMDACITRIRITVNDSEKVDEDRLKDIGVTGVLKLAGNNYQIVVGTIGRSSAHSHEGSNVIKERALIKESGCARLHERRSRQAPAPSIFFVKNGWGGKKVIKRFLDCNSTDFRAMTKKEILTSIKASEGRVIVSEIIGPVQPLL